jgi:hypothetical protein
MSSAPQLTLDERERRARERADARSRKQQGLPRRSARPVRRASPTALDPASDWAAFSLAVLLVCCLLAGPLLTRKPMDRDSPSQARRAVGDAGAARRRQELDYAAEAGLAREVALRQLRNARGSARIFWDVHVGRGGGRGTAAYGSSTSAAASSRTCDDPPRAAAQRRHASAVVLGRHASAGSGSRWTWTSAEASSVAPPAAAASVGDQVGGGARKNRSSPVGAAACRVGVQMRGP